VRLAVAVAEFGHGRRVLYPGAVRCDSLTVEHLQLVSRCLERQHAKPHLRDGERALVDLNVFAPPGHRRRLNTGGRRLLQCRRRRVGPAGSTAWVSYGR